MIRDMIDALYLVAFRLNIVHPSPEIYQARIYKHRQIYDNDYDHLKTIYLKHRNHPMVRTYHC